MLKLRKILLLDKLYITFFLFALIYSLIVTNIIKYKSVYKENETNFTCIINTYKIKEETLSLELNCKEKLIGTYYFKDKKEINSFLNTYNIGSKINIKGSLEKPSNNTIPNLFNYKKYLYNKKIYYLLNIESFKIEKEHTSNLYRIKNFFYKRSNTFKNKSYMYAFILGKTSYIKEDIIESFRKNGVGHLFALSGLHVGFITLILLKILNKFSKNEIFVHIILFIILLLFSFITGFSPSILRSVLMFFYLGINKIYYFNIKTENIMYLVFITLVLINPFIIYETSFILSFIITYFLVISNNYINNKNYILSLLSVSLISFISISILNIYYFNYINILGILLNLLFVPLISNVVFPLTIITFIIPFIEPILTLFIKLIEYLSLTFSKFGIYIYFIKIPIIIVIIYLIVLFIIIKTNKKKLFIINIIILLIIKVYPYIDSNTYIYYIDVNQGDSSLIVFPHLKQTVLIDTGGKINSTYNLTSKNLIPFFRSIGINKIDYLVLTHGDADHMKEAINLIKEFKVKNVIFNCGNYNNLENKTLDLINKNKINNYTCIKELNIKSKFLFLNNNIYDNENDNSIVLYTKINDFKFLFMGDASKRTEENIIKEYNLSNIDFLKVAHHGSKTSSSKEFIENINPKYSIISVGLNNKYGHPNIETLENLKDSKIYRTDINGTIRVKIKNDKLYIKTYEP